MSATRILVVEDESIVAKDIENRLHRLGYQVSATASSGAQALQKVAETNPGLVLMDIRLKGEIDGVETARQIHERHSIPVVYLTAYTDSETLQRAKVTEPFGYILKPFEERDLQTTIEMALYRHKMEQALRENEQWLTITLRSIGHGVITTGTDGKVTFMNPVAEALTGWRLEEALGQHLTTVFRIIDSNTTAVAGDGLPIATWNEIVANALPQPLLIARDQTRTPITAVTTPIESPTKTILGMVLVFEDITERNRVQNAMRESEARFRAIFESTVIGVMLLDLNGRMVRSNNALHKMLGYDEAALSQLYFTDLIHPADVSESRKLFQGLVAGDYNHFQVEQRYVCQDEQLVWGYLTMSLVRDNQNRPWFITGMIEDITNRRQLEEQLLQTQKMEAVGRLAGGIAHDFNNLLTIILSYSDLLLRRVDDDSPLRRNILEIKKAGDRAASLTRQLLTFSRKHNFQPKVIDLNFVVADLETMLSRVIRADIELITRLTPNLSRIKSDPRQIEQVIVNLALNARDAMPSGGTLVIETANIEIDQASSLRNVNLLPGPCAVLSVSDTGIGMDMETKSRIFEPFFTTKEQGEGTGLGLSIVFSIIQQSGGGYSVESEPNKGTIFRIFFPKTEEPLADADEPPDLKPAETPTGAETVLLVEDEERVRELVYGILHRKGYKVLQAACGEDALETSQTYREPIHLLVTDIVMPGMSGQELADQLTAANTQLKVLYISGHTDQSITKLDLEKQGSAFLQKPFTPNELVAKVRHLLDGSVTEAAYPS